MNKSIKQMEHEECISLLPAYINGKLDSGEQLAVQQHIARCALCFEAQQDAENLKTQLADAPKEIEELLSSSSMQKNLNKTLNEIDALEATEQATHVQISPKRSFISSWIETIREQWDITPFGARGLIAGQFASIIAVVGLLGLFMTQPGQNFMSSNSDGMQYQTLSENRTGVTAYNPQDYQVYRIVFHNAATEQDMRSLMNSVGGQIISGPSITGVYTIAVLKDEKQNDLIINALRHSPWTRLVEPAVPGNQLSSPVY